MRDIFIIPEAKEIVDASQESYLCEAQPDDFPVSTVKDSMKSR